MIIDIAVGRVVVARRTPAGHWCARARLLDLPTGRSDHGRERPCTKHQRTSIIGSLPRPSWYTAGLGAQSFLEAMMNLRYREQYEDAVSVFLRAQETAGLDIVTDGDAHFDEQISGMSWQSYPLTHMSGFSQLAEPSAYQMATGAPRGHILHDFLEARVLPKITGPVGPGNLQYTAM
jgi:5-methyltetrahydropteroyltriglutamate--homocysteine methyltransferase